MRAKGQLTVFLSLILMLMLSLLLALFESAQIRMSMSEARSMSSMALDSVFGEFHKELEEQYHLLFLDGSYLEGAFAEGKILDHYRSFLFCGTESYAGTAPVGKPVNWGCTLQKAEITALEFATDSQAAPFRRQIDRYIQECMGLGLVKDLVQTDRSREKAAEKINVQRKIAQTLSQNMTDGSEITAQIEQNDQIEAETQASLAQSNPVDEVWAVKEKRILTQILSAPEEVSKRAVDPDTLASARTLKAGYGEVLWDSNGSSALSSLYFREYIRRTFSCFQGETQAREGLQYELEYLIAGKSSDRENLEKVLRELLGIRLAENYFFLMGNASKRAEAEALSAVICTLGLIPEAKDALTQVILLAWAYGESVLDLKTLTQGGEASIIPNDAEWQLPLGQLGSFASVQPRTTELATGGLDYADWLMLLLYTGSEQTQTYRVMDLIEINLRATQGNNSFCMDSCVEGISIETTWGLKRGITYSFPVSYGYQ